MKSWKDSGGQIDGEKIPGDLKHWNLLEKDINEAESMAFTSHLFLFRILTSLRLSNEKGLSG
jgi:hypothetical protein